jgi:hypothetical protein
MSMDREDLQRDNQALPPDVVESESGMPGGGKGRKDETGRSGVYPVSDMEGASGDATTVGEMEWGQGERGEAGYYDSGSSEIMVEDGTDIPGEGGVSGDITHLGSSPTGTTSTTSQPATDPTDPATDPLSGLPE